MHPINGSLKKIIRIYTYMEKHSFKSIAAAIFGVIGALVFVMQASAMTPTLSLVNNGYGAVTATVYGDANAPVILDYYSGGQLLGAGVIGYTSYNGYFSGSLNQGNYYNIPNGAQVLVMVNGQQSGTVLWQGNGTNYNNNNYNYNYNSQYPYNNNGSNYNYYNQSYPTYQNNYSSAYSTYPIVVSNSNVQVTVGSSATVNLSGGYGNTYYDPYNNNGYNNNSYYNYGSNNYYITNNMSGIASVSLNGNTLIIYGMSAGTTSVTVCQTGGNSCVTVTITVNSPYVYNGGYYNNGYNNGYPPSGNGNWYWNTIQHCWSQR